MGGKKKKNFVLIDFLGRSLWLGFLFEVIADNPNAELSSCGDHGGFAWTQADGGGYVYHLELGGVDRESSYWQQGWELSAATATVNLVSA